MTGRSRPGETTVTATGMLVPDPSTMIVDTRVTGANIMVIKNIMVTSTTGTVIHIIITDGASPTMTGTTTAAMIIMTTTDTIDMMTQACA
jgi:hypothetical protein